MENEHSTSAFIELALDAGVLKFGDFTLKSGRKSPYFFNAGLFYQGDSLRQLGEFYAHTLLKHQITCEHLFGPAYKGISLATTTAVALAHRGINATVTFNRKEAKQHGEGGELIGAPLTRKKVVMIDDVITAGTAFREAKSHIEQQGGTLTTVIIALDRCERGLQSQSTLKDIESEGIRVLSIITLHDLMTYLQDKGEVKLVKQLMAYQELYGLQ